MHVCKLLLLLFVFVDTVVCHVRLCAAELTVCGMYAWTAGRLAANEVHASQHSRRVRRSRPKMVSFRIDYLRADALCLCSMHVPSTLDSNKKTTPWQRA